VAEKLKITEKEKPIKKERQMGLDILRMLAILFVFITHAFSYKKVLSVNVCTNEWTMFLALRFLVLACVPIFIMLTGYLNDKKEISFKYYKGLIPLLVSYVFISLLELFGTHAVFLGENGLYFDFEKIKLINWGVEAVKLLNYTENSYAWYLEMYIGLFLLIPFLNVLWNGLKNNKEKWILVATLCFLTLIPKSLEGINFEWLKEAGLEGWLDVLPDFWKAVYPLTFFFIGKLIKDIKPNLNIIIRILLVIVSVAIQTAICYFASKPTMEYAWDTFKGFGTITNGFVAVSVFLMFYDIQKKIPVISTIISQIAICSFDMYLFSSIFDKIYYNVFPEQNMFVIILMVLVSTYLCARIWITIRDFVLKKVLKIK
jgi:surface polysaccharide O-acyltransferase-like enzyme